MFSLTDALSQLLTDIERGRSKMKAAMPLLKALTDTRKRYESAVARWQDFTDSGSSNTKDLASHKLRNARLLKKLDRQERSYELATAFRAIFVDNLNLLLQRLPLKQEWRDYRDEVSKLRIGEPGAWTEPPARC
jgi:hypothetical protein